MKIAQRHVHIHCQSRWHCGHTTYNKQHSSLNQQPVSSPPTTRLAVLSIVVNCTSQTHRRHGTFQSIHISCAIRLKCRPMWNINTIVAIIVDTIILHNTSIKGGSYQATINPSFGMSQTQNLVLLQNKITWAPSQYAATGKLNKQTAYLKSMS